MTINAIKWIDALFENKYKQGTGQLGNEEKGFCCLGVCLNVNGIYDFEHYYATSDLLCPLVGLKSKYGVFKDYLSKDVYIKTSKGEIYSLVNMNDTGKFDFPEIAKHILLNIDFLFIPEVAEKLTVHYDDKIKKFKKNGEN